jgi:hypothetical protein
MMRDKYATKAPCVLPGFYLRGAGETSPIKALTDAAFDVYITRMASTFVNYLLRSH